MKIDGDRLREDIEANAEFGALDVEGHGRTVLTGTDANRKAREYFVERLEDAGLDVRVDSVGNIAGRWTPESADPESKPVAAGSHLDSVPEGGIFDGPLGVYAALEAVRAMQDAEIEPSRPIDVVSFTEEEGQRFADGLLGSSVAVGERSVEEALELRDGRTTLADALDTMDFDGEGRIDASEWDSWLELHVEQSRRLERADCPVGVVTTITGITHCAVEVLGEANHAGATPMPERTDALVAASEFVRDVEDGANEVGETTVGTVGKLDVRPNATNVVPGAVEMGVDIRDVSYDAMNELVSLARDSLSRLESERGVETTFSREFDLEPTEMSARCRRALHEAGDEANIELLDMHSGAAHDTMHVGDVTDAAMLFARSRDGISHNPAEWTEWGDCAAATRVLAGALTSLAR
ncbi:N-carbamoyl-L-amino-acid hydrolase [Haladaptatus litoreus]|uniref:N-carbamoyl-L-amino-acid hydrolase n=1 Tax=Haladaptatus litoreus TaxID=553468 RepID=A0A1N7E9G6_9EURY|nr:M20 family metallo-hydrolase [Haladaptatus litoreus]SIR84782.1 N-carbamoyl-L-amino-acid hydrolase [Haladaptatus litoreus]